MTVEGIGIQMRRRSVEDNASLLQPDDALRELLRQRHVVNVYDGGQATLGADLDQTAA
ncbi:MAG: hypothetical protein MZW92_39640 [Comamonadaceae bacterium]|nr:hypothetical protein [Comamonadaceae bacterium]